MHRATLWIFSALTVAVVGALIGYQLHIGTTYLPPLSLSGSGAAAGGARPSMSSITAICKQLTQQPQSVPGFPGLPGGGG